ncbi:LLM class flavin-dependent oxidoreductase [Streptomyces sp. NPDC018031]|uniref:LLM class flavin-dependent oxidoreductase n=1 Tax=Streptomyces sp. NPDC018031 TaxID=3365033 RepID=UPI0037BDA47B
MTTTAVRQQPAPGATGRRRPGPPAIGVFLPTPGPEPGGRAAEIKAAARRAEQLGFESVWTGDHLIGRTQVVDGGLALATAAAVTDTIRIGFGVLHLPLLPVAQAARGGHPSSC